MLANISYTTTNTALQVIDTFDLPTTKTIYCEIHALDRNDASVSQLIINHNGISTSEIQTATSINNIQPAEIQTDINNNVGRILVQPLVTPTQYTITQNIVECNLYSENTVSGRLIRHTEGLGMYLVATNENMSIRQANNNFFGNVSEFAVSNMLGPITTRSELYEANNVQSYGDSSIAISNNDFVIQASGQFRNHNYIELTVTPGTVYRVAANAYYTFEEVLGTTATVDVAAKIAVGTVLAGEDIDYIIVNPNAADYAIEFTPQTETVFIGLGFGDLGTTLYVNDFSIKELVPFHTYNQIEGSVFVNWNAVPAETSILVFGDNSVRVDATNNIFINTVNCGSQQTNNKVSYTYSNGDILYSINGSSVVLETAEYYSNVTQLSYETTINEFSFVPTIISNTEHVGLTNG